MEAGTIARLLAPFVSGLSGHQIDQVSTYLDLLLRWNARMNLTSLRQPEQIVTRHFGESFFAAACLLPDPNAAVSAIDLGSGAGFPGLPLKLYAPCIDLALIESNQRKATFLREVVRALGLDRVRVFAGRAEDFGGRAQLVTMRAVERFDRSLPAAASLLQPQPSAPPGSRLAALVGQAQVAKAHEVAPDLKWDKPVPIPGSQTRVLLVGKCHSRQESIL